MGEIPKYLKDFRFPHSMLLLLQDLMNNRYCKVIFMFLVPARTYIKLPMCTFDI